MVTTIYKCYLFAFYTRKLREGGCAEMVARPDDDSVPDTEPVGDGGPNTDSSNVRECLRRERATMLMCSCLCLLVYICIKMSQDRAFVSVSAADSPSALSILLLQSSLSRLFILLPLFRRLHRLMYRISGLRQMSHRQLTFLSGYETSWQTMTPLP